MNSDDPYLDVLQNLESIVVATYRENTEMTDYAPMRVYEALIEKYSSEKLNRPAKSHDLSLLEKELFQRVYGMCEWRMGRDGELKEQLGTENISAVDLEIMILCLKRLVKSVSKWTKRNGRTGYLRYIGDFIPSASVSPILKLNNKMDQLMDHAGVNKDADEFPEMEFFYSRYPEIAEKETRTATLIQTTNGLPAATYGFIEMYCNQKKCDCRRVMIVVSAKEMPNTVFATFDFGWETNEFYQAWMKTDGEKFHALREGMLSPFQRQSELAESLLVLFKNVVLKDEEYKKRLIRHYDLFRSRL